MNKTVVGIILTLLISLDQNCLGVGDEVCQFDHIETTVQDLQCAGEYYIKNATWSDLWRVVALPLIIAKNVSRLHLDAQFGNWERVNDLIYDYGYDVNLLDAEGDTPLICALYGNHTNIVKLLLHEGADRDVINNNGKMAITLARERNVDPEIINMLENSDDYDCAICLEENHYGNKHSCGNSFHWKCIADWRRAERNNVINPSCPMCRLPW